MTGRLKYNHTWQEYLRKTAYTMPATESRWGGSSRLIYQGIVINGIHTGRSLTNLNTEQISRLLSQASNRHDKALLQAHLAKRTGPQPGAPADQ